MKVFQITFPGVNGITGTTAYEVIQLTTSVLHSGDVMTSAIVVASSNVAFPVGTVVSPGHLSAMFDMPVTLGALGVMVDHTDLSNTTILATIQRGA